MMKPRIDINGRRIASGEPAYIVAEMSANHNHDFDQAVQLMRAAKDAGADAVKLQTYTPETMTIDSKGDLFRISGGTLWDGKTLFDLYGDAFTPWEWQPQLFEIGKELGLDVFSTAFDDTAVDFLEEQLDVPLHKVASFEIVDIPLIEKMAATGKPMIISTGMASFAETEEAVKAARAAGAGQIALLKCTSAYPAPPKEMNLRTIPEMEDVFGVPIGLSDHTLGIAVPVAAVTLGACIVEKHFTVSRKAPGPDSAFSLEPSEFSQMVEAVRVAEAALGQVHYGFSEKERTSKIFRRSLFVVQDVGEGELFTNDNVRSIRPGHGLPPKHLGNVLGRRAAQNIPEGTPLSWELVGN